MYRRPVRALILALIVVLVGISGFGLGRRSGAQLEPSEVVISDNQIFFRATAAGIIESPGGEEKSVSTESVVASKNGTKYHYPWCGSANRIKEENKISFSSIEKARAAGYNPAANCEGLK